VAQRRVPARLLVLGTYRPVEAAIQQHPLRHLVRELCGRGYAVERRLELLTRADVTAYLAGRLGGAVSPRLAAVAYERTEGHALFLVNVVEHLVSQRVVVQREGQWTLKDGAEAQVAILPEGLRQLLVRRLEDLPSEARRVLEAASVAGEQFTAAAVAAGVQDPMEDVEAACEGLGRRAGSSTTSASGSGRTGPAAGATSSPMRSTGRCCMRGWGRCGAGNSTGASAYAWRRATAHRRSRSRPGSPSISSAGARSRGPWSICSRWGRMRRGAVPLHLTVVTLPAPAQVVEPASADVPGV
jgi:hypothetical protein